MFIPILLGTGRESNSTKNVANFVLNAVEESKLFDTEIIDVKDFHSEITIAAWDTDSKKDSWQKTMERADGLIVICPEYNHSFPGELKILLDSIFDEYARKPMGVCAVSSGGLGGARVAEQLHLLAVGLKMVPMPNPMYFSSVKEVFDTDGEILDQKYNERVAKFLEDFFWYAKVLKEGRNNK